MNRFEETKKAGLFGIIGNIFLLIIKGTVGFVFKSQAMIADAANSAGDIFASLMTFIGNKIASTPEDSDHNFGHGKAEYLFSMFIAISMVVIAFKLLYLYTSRLAKKYNNILLEANKKDHFNDCIVTSLTLVSILFTLINIYWFDSIVGITISIWICITGFKIFMESYNILMDKSIDPKTEEIITDIAHNYKEIQKLDAISSTPVGYKYIVVLTICVDGNMSTFDSHKLADKFEKDVNELDNVYKAIVHVNPI